MRHVAPALSTCYVKPPWSALPPTVASLTRLIQSMCCVRLWLTPWCITMVIIEIRQGSVDWIHLVQASDEVAGSGEHGSESSYSIKCWQFEDSSHGMLSCVVRWEVAVALKDHSVSIFRVKHYFKISGSAHWMTQCCIPKGMNPPQQCGDNLRYCR
jgi:hypothetical protein